MGVYELNNRIIRPDMPPWGYYAGVLTGLLEFLFGAGEQGVFFVPEPIVLGKQVLFQDADGTVPVTADGDPVGLMLDLSGNGNHGTQSVSAASPIYPGLYYDGGDDFINLTGLNIQGTSRTFMIGIDTANLQEDSAILGWAGEVWLYARTTFGAAHEQVRLMIGSDEVLIGPDIRDTGYRTVGLRQNWNTWTLFIDGSPYVEATFNYTADMDNWMLGRSPHVEAFRWFRGSAGAFAANNTAWTAEEVQRVHEYILGSM